MAKKATPAKAPKGGEHDRPPDDAPEEEIKWYNAFVKEWKNSGKRYFANDEAIWRAIVPRLKFTGHSTTVIYNHFIGKLRKDIDWGHLVAALIMWGPDIVKTSAFGWPMSILPCPHQICISPATVNYMGLILEKPLDT
ncbi:hypothetical protein ACHAPU_002638 [Fusarium lateritium]